MASKKIAGRIIGVRYSTQFRSSTLIINTGTAQEEVSLSAKQLLSKAGVVRPHNLKGASVMLELHELGTMIPNPSVRGSFIEQTQARIDAGRGIKDFDIQLSEAQERLQGELMVYGDVLREERAAHNPVTATAPAAAAPAAAPITLVEEPVVTEVPSLEALVGVEETAPAEEEVI